MFIQLVVLFVLLFLVSHVVNSVGPRHRARLEAVVAKLKEEDDSLSPEVLETYLKSLARWGKIDACLTVFFMAVIISKYLVRLFGLDLFWLGGFVIASYLFWKGVHRCFQPLPPVGDDTADAETSSRTQARKRRNQIAVRLIVVGLGSYLASISYSLNRIEDSSTDVASQAPEVGPAAELKRWGAKLRRYDGEVFEVKLSQTNIPDSELVHLKELPELLELYLDHTNISDEGMVHLKGLVGLGTLTLHNTRVTDSGLKHLGGLTNLTTLVLPSRITDKGLVHLKGLNSLVSLTVGGRISDEGLQNFKELKKLRKLRLNRTQVSDKGVADLQKLLPNCKIKNW